MPQHAGSRIGFRLVSQAKFDELRARLAEISDLVKTAALLGWDQQVMMPPRGASIRAEQMATIGRIAHQKFTSAEVGTLIDDLRGWGEQQDYDSLEAIRALDLDALPPELAEIAELRLRHPSASLRELAAKARPPISKASAHRRLQAVVRLVER